MIPGPADMPSGPAAGTPEHRAKMDQRLKDQGYDDKDARDEILDEIIKGGGTAKEQEANLEKKYAGRSEATRKSENKKKGDERRAKKNGDTGMSIVAPVTTSISGTNLLQHTSYLPMTRSWISSKQRGGRIPTPDNTCSNKSKRPTRTQPRKRL
jgi:hypothetical protein